MGHTPITADVPGVEEGREKAKFSRGFSTPKVFPAASLPTGNSAAIY